MRVAAFNIYIVMRFTRLLFAGVILRCVRDSLSQGFYAVVNQAASSYRFNGSAANPTITLTKGQTYGEAQARRGGGGQGGQTRAQAKLPSPSTVFNVTAANHPFRIIGDTTAAWPQANYTSFPECVSCINQNDVRYGPVIFTVPTGTTSPNVGYVCASHAAMKGTFTLIDPTPSQSGTGSPSGSGTPSQSATASVSPSATRTPSGTSTATSSGTPSQVRGRRARIVAGDAPEHCPTLPRSEHDCVGDWLRHWQPDAERLPVSHADAHAFHHAVAGRDLHFEQ